MRHDTARLARHLSARLEELEGDCVLTRGWPAAADGVVEARFPRSPEGLARSLEGRFSFPIEQAGDGVRFTLSPEVPFEELDALWGALAAAAETWP